jgi:hypothetical protein
MVNEVVNGLTNCPSRVVVVNCPPLGGIDRLPSAAETIRHADAVTGKVDRPAQCLSVCSITGATGAAPIPDIRERFTVSIFHECPFQPVRADLESVPVSPSAAYFAWRNRIVTLITYYHERSHRPVMAFIGRKL